MRLHTNAEPEVIKRAAELAGVTFDKFEIHKSRKAKYGYEVALLGGSKWRPNNNRWNGSDYAATWDQWGVFLDWIYLTDPIMNCRAYKDAGDFDFQTNWRFIYGWPSDYHGDHKWIIGVPYRQTCSKCSAVKRWR